MMLRLKRPLFASWTHFIAFCSCFLNAVLIVSLVVSLATRPKLVQYAAPEYEAAPVPVSRETTEGSEAKASLTRLGEFTVTAYCPCAECCGIYSAEHPANVGAGYVQKTASGTTPQEGRTVAADTSVLPFGTVIVIDGHEYTVEDRGGAVKGNSIDIFFNSHEEALEWGVQTKTIYVKGDF